jgi:cellulose synthase/poly-beta-1,6-N-acetylglucosamine synthase-like glycosyltransferase
MIIPSYAWLAWISLVAASLPLLLFLVNIRLFRRPCLCGDNPELLPVSILIPARNEEPSIADAVQSVLASQGVNLELIVLDDGSTDHTADIVRALASTDPRLRLEQAPPLPAGWNGKQHACWHLASLAQYPVLCFLDADVRLGPLALARMLTELHPDSTGMVTGFPRQLTQTWLEWLLIPLIHFILLGFLPLPGERFTRRVGFAAGCGQFMMVRKSSYFAAGGHSAIRTTMHDGLLLPQLFRRHGIQTHVYDLSADAVCRMYRSAAKVWSGLSKNATEGIAAPSRIGIFTLLLLLGQVLPLLLLLSSLATADGYTFRLAMVAFSFGLIQRIASAVRFRQRWRGVVFDPLGVLIQLALQWTALLRKLMGRPATWKQRSYPSG